MVVVKHGKEGSLGFSADGTCCRCVIYPVEVINTFGAKAYTARALAEFKSCLEQAKQETVTTLIDVKTTALSWLSQAHLWWRGAIRRRIGARRAR